MECRPIAAPCRQLPPVISEQPAHARLELAWIAEPAANRAVEVEDEVAVGRIAEIVGARQVEDLDERLDLATLANSERVRDPHVPREIRVVFPQCVSLQDHAGRVPASVTTDAIGRAGGTLPGGLIVRAAGLGNRWRRVVAHPVVQVHAPGEPHEAPAVEAMTLIAVTPVVLRPQVVRLSIAEREGISLVVIIG